MTTSALAQELSILSKHGQIDERIPLFIKSNLNPGIELRQYQEAAISRFSHYIDKYNPKELPVHLLFHMATGSGKTVIMAASMLYLYSLGYRNFLFFVHNANILEKTKSNFLDTKSIKYLFKEEIRIHNKKVSVVEQENFQDIQQDGINIVFTTMQALQINLNNPKENGLTFADFENKRIILLSDEAHHINALTKQTSGQSEQEAEKTWENTVQNIFKANRENILLEFSATVDMDHVKIREKYEPKLIYKYTLKEFREDKFSKEVKVLESDTDSLLKALQAIIVSQYRRKVAQDNGIYLKPVVLFKSKTIIESERFEKDFHDYLLGLRVSNLKGLANVNVNILRRAFDYFEVNDIAYESLIRELQEEFGKPKCLSVNSQNDSERQQILVNTLEDSANEIRAIFAVDKLNEGWDVLNLFDIVRLYDTRDAKNNKVGKTTMAEAQLIGRGARYFPFADGSDGEKHKRKYDKDLENDLRILEELYYHSTYNPRYIAELNQALIETGIKPEPDAEQEIQLRLKESFLKSGFWEHGSIYINRRIENKNTDKNSIFDFGVDTTYEYKFSTERRIESTVFHPDADLTHSDREHKPIQDIQSYNLEELGTNVIRKALDRIGFFSFNNIVAYTPNYRSRTDLIEDLAHRIKIEIHGSFRRINKLTQDDKLRIALFVLNSIKNTMIANSKNYVGTQAFFAQAVKEVFRNKTLKIQAGGSLDRETGRSMNHSLNPALQLNLLEAEWYVYEDDYGTSEEKYCVKFISTAIKKLKARYTDIFLLRNAGVLRIFAFQDGGAFEPDYIFFLRDIRTKNRLYYQIFIEPKGGFLLETDRWKQDFLRKIESKAKLEILHTDDKYRLVGLPFYNEKQTKHQFSEAFNDLLLDD